MEVSYASEIVTQPSPVHGDKELLAQAAKASRLLHEAIGARVVGQADVVELMLVALLARGHAHASTLRVHDE